MDTIQIRFDTYKIQEDDQPTEKTIGATDYVGEQPSGQSAEQASQELTIVADYIEGLSSGQSTCLAT